MGSPRSALATSTGVGPRKVTASGGKGAQPEYCSPHLLAHVARQLCAAEVDVPDTRGETMDPQLEAVGAERVRLDPVGAPLDVLGVDALDDLGLLGVGE